jgi:peptidyl-prolyl cis-trans isomerase C
MQRQALQRVIDRKLLIKAARDKGLDRTPEFLAEKRRADEMLLAQAYARQQLAAIPVPSDAQVEKFMADRATVYTDRQQLSLDQIRFVPPRDIKALNALDKDKSLDQVAAHLTALGIKYERLPAGLDTGNVPPQLMQAINKLPPTEPFVIPSQGFITVNVITARKPVASDPMEARAAAVRAWRQEQFSDILQQQLTSLRTTTKLDYQNGFGPPGTPPAKPAAAK